MTPGDIAKALQAEFTLQNRVGGTAVTLEELAEFIAEQLRHGQPLWGYYSSGGKKFNLATVKAEANLNADGFRWENPRVRRVAVIDSIGKREDKGPAS